MKASRRIHLTQTFTFRLMILLLLFGLSHLKAEQKSDRFAPEHGNSSSSNTAAKLAYGSEQVISAANPYATDAGFRILERGGNAIDAMVTVQLVLGLVEPQSSGLGGGAFLLYYQDKTNSLMTVDGRETAPAKANETLFLNKDGSPLGFFEAVVGGRSVGTPGTPKLLWEVHQRFGQLRWGDVLTPALELANSGFIVSPRLAEALERDQDRLSRDPDAAAYFYPEGRSLKAGSVKKNAAYAQTLKLLQEHGGNYFYTPEFSQKIVNKVQQHSNPGVLSTQDFLHYRVITRDPVCMPFLAYRICGMGPPSSGGISVNQILGMLEQGNHLSDPAESAPAWHRISEASRLAFADRGLYIADSDYIPLPKGLLAPRYLKHRAGLIRPASRLPEAEPGTPIGTEGKQAFQQGESFEQPSTTHFVVRDSNGDIVSMTSTIENGFGSRLMVHGFLLNNELTDFSFSPEKSGRAIANRVEGGKRPRSSMAPTIVFHDDKPVLALGSPGGSRIINYVANTLIRTLAWQQTLDQAISAPNVASRFGTLDLESGRDLNSLSQALTGMGYSPNKRDLNSGLHGVQRIGSQWLGVADHRREGSVRAK